MGDDDCDNRRLWRSLPGHHYRTVHRWRLDKAGLIYQVTAKFAELDLSEQAVPNDAMGYIFEELLCRFSEMSNETAGEHFTPREVIRLMVILFAQDDKP